MITKKRRGSKRGEGWWQAHGRRRYKIVYAAVTPGEYNTLLPLVQKEGLTMSDFVRRCVNGYLLELGDQVPLLAETCQTPKDSPTTRS